METWREDEVLATRRFYSGLRIWPSIPHDINPQGWLSNFRNGLDSDIALALLDSFVHLTTEHTKRLVESAFHGLSYEIERERSGPPYAGRAWTEFIANVLISFPQDDEDDPAASGRMFVRQARASLVRTESQLREPDDLVRDVFHASSPVDVVLVDDFAGSGDQFLDAMELRYEIPSFEDTSMRDLFEDGKFRSLSYTPAVATELACQRIRERLPGIRVAPAHILPGKYSAADPETLLVPVALRSELPSFLRRYAGQAGYSPQTIYGHQGSGLALSFEHGIPDNTLPIFWSENANWQTLRKRVQA